MTKTVIPHRRMTLVSIVLILILLCICTVIGNALSMLRQESLAEVERSRENLWIFNILTALESPAEKHHDRKDSDFLINKGCRQSTVDPGYFDAAAKIAEAKWCDLTLFGGNRVRIIRLTTISGYNGAITLAAAIEDKRVVRYLEILRHRETADFGAPLFSRERRWLSSLVGRSKDYFSPPPPGNELDAISGATISGGAVLAALTEMFRMTEISGSR